MDDIQTVTNSHLMDMGIKSYPHRDKIIKGITAHFTVKPHPRHVKKQDESKQNDVNFNQNTNNTNSRSNPLMICIGIEQYEALANLKTAQDIAMYKAVFEKLYDYQVIANDPSKPMNHDEMLSFLRKIRTQHLYDYHEDRVNHDSLIVTFGGHGTYDSVICSDGSKVKHKEIRDAFKLPELNQIPKIFLFDSCRTDDDPEEEEDEEKQKHRGVPEARGFSVT
eukprot:17570_1